MRFLTFLLFLSLFTLLLSSTTFSLDLDCPPKDSPDAELKPYLVFVKPPGLLGIVGNLISQLLLLVKCLGRTVIKLGSGELLFNDKDIVIDLSFDGIPDLSIYHGHFSQSFVDLLKDRSDVDFVEAVKPVKIESVIPPYNLVKRTTQSSAPYNLDRINQKNFPLDGSYSYPTDAGLESNVYVIDTGIDIQNVEFEGRASHGGTFCGNCSNTDDHGHGTNVAGIIGGKKFGVAKKTKLIAIKVLNQNGQGSSATVTAGISAVITKHKNSSNKNTIINLSLGAPFSSAINKMVNDSSTAGIHVVASSGDSGANACDFSPSSAPQAIVVGATEKTTNSVSSFSNTGSCVTLYAPGRDIVAAGAGDDNTLLSKASGTSQSCPHAAGAVALIISKNGNSKPSTMKSSLVSLAVKGILDDSPNAFLQVPTP